MKKRYKSYFMSQKQMGEAKLNEAVLNSNIKRTGNKGKLFALLLPQCSCGCGLGTTTREINPVPTIKANKKIDRRKEARIDTERYKQYWGQ